MPYGPAISAEYANGSSIELHRPSRNAFDALLPVEDEMFRYVSEQYYNYHFLSYKTSHFFSRVILPMPQTLHWGIHISEQHQRRKLVGLCSVDTVADEFDVFVLRVNMRGRGIGSQVSRLVMAAMFASGKESMYTDINPDNAPSLAMADRLSMTMIGEDLDENQLMFSLNRPELPQGADFADMVRALGEMSLVDATMEGSLIN